MWERARYFPGVRRGCWVRASNCIETLRLSGGLLSIKTRGGSWVCVSPAAGLDTLGPVTTLPGGQLALCRGHGEGSSFSCLKAACTIILSSGVMRAEFCSAGPAHSSGYGEVSGSLQASSIALGLGVRGSTHHSHLATSYFCKGQGFSIPNTSSLNASRLHYQFSFFLLLLDPGSFTFLI